MTTTRPSGVSRDASAAEIKKAFHRPARKYHPDISKEANAEARMKAGNEAYAVFSDPEKRAAYDRLGQNHQAGQDFRPPPDWGEAFELSTRGFFSQLFSGPGGFPRGAPLQIGHRDALGAPDRDAARPRDTWGHTCLTQPRRTRRLTSTSGR
ncbi:DnaJ domain-containing protein [Denitromonas halophila]|uniref:DnaJ domain-containing protein n=1 Tax=Denitromonas halophila TaxID=1629404 RepID=UPI001FE94FB7|nr:DnaJ domain-containing protein [Denitromonas halophila]